MYYKVKILKSLPKAKTGMQINGALANDAAPFGGGINKGIAEPSVRKTIEPVERSKANLEAEKGETVFTYDESGIPLFYTVGGERHFNGGTPLNLPDDSFIFSDTKAMKISDPQILKMFGKPKGSYTPAELSKVYDINVYRKILQDPNSDNIMRKTAEMMIKNYVIKLGALALAQESKKGFPQGMPKIAKPYLDSQGLSEKDLIPEGMGQEQVDPAQQQMPPQQRQAPTQMPSGQPVAMPEDPGMEQQMPPEQMQPPMQRFGGARTLRRAQEGMQQPSPEQMAMMQQQQQGQGQEQGGDQMQQMMQQVSQALQQGAKPEEVVAQLLQKEIAPEEIAQIFVELGMPEDEVQQLIMGVIQQLQGGQQQQMDPRQQQQPSQEEMMAMQQQMQQAPMAAYGMQMGGYDMPDYMAYGGYYENDGYLRKAGNGEEVKGKKGNIPATGVKTIGADYTPTTTLSNKTAGYKLTEGEKRANAKGVIGGGSGGTPSSGWEDAICDMIKAGATYEQLTDPKVAFEFTGSRKTHMAPGPKSKAIFDRCNVNAAKFEDTEDAVYIDGQPETECWCTVDGEEVPGKTNPDWDGVDPATKCLPCDEYEDNCYCPDPKDPSKKIKVNCKDDGTPPDCEAWKRGEGQGQGGYEPMMMDEGMSDLSKMRIMADLTMRKPDIDPELIMPDEINPWATGIDPRQKVHAANAQLATMNKGLTSLSGDTGSYVTNSLGLQAPTIVATNEAIDNANKYNSDTRNVLSYATTASINKGMDEKDPYIQHYLQDKNVKKAEKTLFDNTKKATVVNDIALGMDDKLKRDLINDANENFKYDRNWRKHQVSGKKVKPEKTYTFEDYLRYYRDKVGITDQKALTSAAKTAMDRQDQITKLGGQTFKHGGFIYSVFPNIL
jgi:hypothetical protein